MSDLGLLSLDIETVEPQIRRRTVKLPIWGCSLAARPLALARWHVCGGMQ